MRVSQVQTLSSQSLLTVSTFGNSFSTGFHDTHSLCFLLASLFTQVYFSFDGSSSSNHCLNIIFPWRRYLVLSSFYTFSLRILHMVPPITDNYQIFPLSQHCSSELQNQVCFFLLDISAYMIRRYSSTACPKLILPVPQLCSSFCIPVLSK